MSAYLDKLGKQLTPDEWCRLTEDVDYRRIADTTTKTGIRVSTVWLGLDHNYNGGPPEIFETMVFPNEDCFRFSTENEARAKHWSLVLEYGGHVK